MQLDTNKFFREVGEGISFDSKQNTFGDVMRKGNDMKVNLLDVKMNTETNPFQKQLNEASQRLRNAQIAMMNNGGARDKMELAIAQQAFEKAHTLAIQFDNPAPAQSPFSVSSRRSDRKSDSGLETDGSSVSSNASTRSHPYARPNRNLSKRERNKISATKYRNKRKMYVQQLESKCQNLTSTVESLKASVAALQAQNKLLKDQMGFLKQLLQQSKASQQVNTSSISRTQPVNNNNTFTPMQFNFGTMKEDDTAMLPSLPSASLDWGVPSTAPEIDMDVKF
mmetsp:Transcript_2937/g.4317  ORF Transcript_2937/g.4317 Transcript_2937/m.4317 type:complete len:281 (-) Transcript_2937:74-916(-)